MGQKLEFLAPLFVPAHRPERFDKVAASGADAIFLDLEDAVPAEAKEAARAALRDNFTALPVLVRINGVGTPWHDGDLTACLALEISGLVVPKMELGSDFAQLAASLAGRMPIVALIETARGLVDARSLAQWPAVGRLAFGSIDYCADLGCAHTREALLAARSELVLASRLAKKPAPLDGVTASLDDEALVRSDARYAHEMGFGGKLCIHPGQVAWVRDAFRPSAAEVAWARQVVAAEGAGGAANLGGTMIDAPVVARARRILEAV